MGPSSSTENPYQFHFADELDRGSFFSIRPGETRIGEQIHWLKRGDDPRELRGSYVLVALEEDLGPRANLGLGGARSAWKPAVQGLLGQQANRFFDGSQLTFAGVLAAPAMADASVDQLRQAVAQLDDVLIGILLPFFQAGKTVLVVGGGHNNGYPLLKSLAAVHPQGVAAINLDAHTDLRFMEGRHSGNGFRAALEEGLLKRYAALGLAESATPEPILADLANRPEVLLTSWEDMYLRNQPEPSHALYEALMHVQGYPCGLELDTDLMQGFPSSAMALTGISLHDMRRWVHYLAKDMRYFHLTEASPGRGPWPEAVVGKALGTLLLDFMKSHAQ